MQGSRLIDLQCSLDVIDRVGHTSCATGGHSPGSALIPTRRGHAGFGSVLTTRGQLSDLRLPSVRTGAARLACIGACAAFALLGAASCAPPQPSIYGGPAAPAGPNTLWPVPAPARTPP